MLKNLISLQHFSLTSAKSPWLKYRIKIDSESIRIIPIYCDICIRADANHSKLIRETFCISYDEKRPKIDPINSETSIWMNTNQSETKFSIQIKLISDWSKPNFQSESIRINPMSKWFGSILIENSIWINPSSNWFGLTWIENLVSDWFGLMSRN